MIYEPTGQYNTFPFRSRGESRLGLLLADLQEPFDYEPFSINGLGEKWEVDFHLTKRNVLIEAKDKSFWWECYKAIRVTDFAIRKGERFWVWLVDTSNYWKPPIIHQLTCPIPGSSEKVSMTTFQMLDCPIDEYLAQLDEQVKEYKKAA